LGPAPDIAVHHETRGARIDRRRACPRRWSRRGRGVRSGALGACRWPWV